jgi:hypothetical protein
MYICYPLAALSESSALISTATQTIHNFSSKDKLLDCISDLNTWMAHNFLQLNHHKIKVLIVGAKAQRENLAAHLNSWAIKIKHQVKNLGVILDSELNFSSHIWNVIKIHFLPSEEHCQGVSISLLG